MKKIILSLFLFICFYSNAQDKKYPPFITYDSINGYKVPKLEMRNLIRMSIMSLQEWQELMKTCDFQKKGIEENCSYYSIEWAHDYAYFIYKCPPSKVIIAWNTWNYDKYIMDSIEDELSKYYKGKDGQSNHYEIEVSETKIGIDLLRTRAQELISIYFTK